MEGKILVVDDSKMDQLIIGNVLKNYIVLTADNGLQAINIIKKEPDIDMIILDLKMPIMNGFEVLEELYSTKNPSEIPTIILSNYEEVEKEIKGLDMGAVDYIRKPLNVKSLSKRVNTHLSLSKARKYLENYNTKLESEVKKRTNELVLTRDITINALVSLLEVRDIESSNHAKRTQEIISLLCNKLKTKNSFKEELSDKCDLIVKTSPLHDIGKVGIPDKILLKPGKLNQEEFELMKKHVIYGQKALKVKSKDNIPPLFIQTAMNIIGYHHEKYDGSGYPNNLKGKNIPIEGRIMAIVDVYDALTSKRVYKKAYSHKCSIKIIKSERGKHFDPDIVDVFIAYEKEINKISKKYKAENTIEEI